MRPTRDCRATRYATSWPPYSPRPAGDTYVVDSLGDTITAAAGEGIDTVRTALEALGGNDTINAGGSADVINGGDGNDTLNAGAGIDSITGGAGADTLNGGLGDDTFVFAPGFGNDVINGFDDAVRNQDVLAFAGGITAAEAAVSDAGADNLITVNKRQRPSSNRSARRDQRPQYRPRRLPLRRLKPPGERRQPASPLPISGP